MTKFMLAAASALALGAAPAHAQLLGNVGGAVSGALNGTARRIAQRRRLARRHAEQRWQCRQRASMAR